jgi:hypothetical protein
MKDASCKYSKEMNKQTKVEHIDGHLFIPVFMVQHTARCKILGKKKLLPSIATMHLQ